MTTPKHLKCIDKRIYVAYDLNMSKKPMKPRVVRVPDRLWEAAQKRAAEREETVSEVIRRCLEKYGRP